MQRPKFLKQPAEGAPDWTRVEALARCGIWYGSYIIRTSNPVQNFALMSPPVGPGFYIML